MNRPADDAAERAEWKRRVWARLDELEHDPRKRAWSFPIGRCVCCGDAMHTGADCRMGRP